jgi:vesicle transport through interaction with t-SNAREs protein 1
MSNPLDTDAGSELFSSYEAELKLVQADLNQKLDQIAESSGEQRKSAIRAAERALEEANELVGNLLKAPFLGVHDCPDDSSS